MPDIGVMSQMEAFQLLRSSVWRNTLMDSMSPVVICSTLSLVIPLGESS